jgi:hypothetical protein
MFLSRRRLLDQGLATGALAGALAAGGPLASAAPRDSGGPGGPGGRQVEVADITFANFTAQLQALIRVECNLAPLDSPVWFYWTAFAITPEIAPTPVVGFEGLELSRVVQRRDGSYFAKGIDLSFPRDHRTGKFTSTALHPVTGETLEVPVSVLDGSFDPGYVISPEVGWWPLRAAKPATPDLSCRWWRESQVGRMQRERTSPPGFPKTFIEAGYYEFAMSDFNDPRVTSVPYRTGGIYVFPFPKWMKMGDRPGHMLGMITGRKLGSVTQLPAEFLARAEKEHPDLLSLETMFRTIPQP